MSGSVFNHGPAAVPLATGQSTNSPGDSTPEEVEDDPNAASSAHWQALHDQTSPDSATPATRAAAPLQKRRRVTRACDECRRKKIKCDGKQPCTHCTVYSYDCTYDQPSNRRRNPAPQYIEALEARLHRAEALLKAVLPNIDLNDTDLDAIIRKQRQDGDAKAVSDEEKSSEGPRSLEQDSQLRSMIESTGQLDIDEAGHYDFYGGSSGAVFVRRMREQFGSLLGNNNRGLFLPRMPRPTPLGPLQDSPKSSLESPFEMGLPNTIDLPSRETAKTLCQVALNCACALLRFVHQPTFYEMFDRIYDNSPENFGDEENRYLPLLYVVLALGCMFHENPDSSQGTSTLNSYQISINQGVKYFKAARQMMDVTECRDITSLQAILFMVLFLQSSANLSTCYSYIGIALRTSLRMGLHRNIAGNFNPIERETRRRVFWIVRKMDTYVSAMLGFPQMLSLDDIDQEFPIEVDDEYITKEAILPMPPGKTSLLAAANAHTRLNLILTKVIKYIYPTKGMEQSVKANTKSSYGISHSKIREIERDLGDWLDKLPMELRPGGEGTPEVLRVQQLLRLAYAHVQMMLYRPFIHYVSQQSSKGKPIDERSYACAAACISVSRNIVHITTEMKRRGLLIGAYWFTMYTTFFAILALVFFVLENPDKPGSKEILADAHDGNDALRGLAERSQAADRCSIALSTLFEQLPERLGNDRFGSTNIKKKRSAPSPTPPVPRTVPRTPDLSRLEPTPLCQRATTFPVSTPTYNAKSQLGINTASNPNLRQSFQEFISPTDLSSAGTPNSINTDHSIQPPQYNIPQQFTTNDGLADLNAIMFPSADPFAYPNPAMSELENVKEENMGGMQGSQAAPLFVPNETSGPGIYDDLEGQFFGPLPPYLMQGQQMFDVSGQVGAENNMLSGFSPPQVSYPLNTDFNLDAIYTSGDDSWNHMSVDQQYK